MSSPENNEIVIYTTPDGKETFEVNLKKDSTILKEYDHEHGPTPLYKISQAIL